MPNKEQLELLRSGVEAWNAWRSDDGEVDLTDADLSGADLRRADLSRADLSFAVLCDANLSGANLSGADLNNAYLCDVDLSQSDLSRVDFRRANLKRADLCGAELCHADLREADLRGADLSKANLGQANLGQANLDRANLRDANLRQADLSAADLCGAHLNQADLCDASFCDADLSSADLSAADLCGADLSHAKLIDAVLIDANLSSANLTFGNLSGANLSGANLADTLFRTADFTGTSLENARFEATFILDCDLAPAQGLDQAQHDYPGSIGTSTLDLTAQGLAKNPANRGPVETFLRGAGVTESIMQTFALMIENPIEFYSCFISYSHRDKPFARRIYDHLQAQGIRCWLDEHQLLPGDDIYDMVDRGIRIWDKVLLCCSEDSLTSWWVEDEIDKALEKERKLRDTRGKKILAIIPLNLDGYLFDGWQDGRAATIRKRLAADFTGWETDNQKFEDQFEKVVQALRTERDPAPEPKL